MEMGFRVESRTKTTVQMQKKKKVNEIQNYSKEPEGLRTNDIVVRTDSALSLLQSNSSPSQRLLTAPRHMAQSEDKGHSPPLWVISQPLSLEPHSNSLRHVLRSLLLSLADAVTELLNHLTQSCIIQHHCRAFFYSTQWGVAHRADMHAPCHWRHGDKAYRFSHTRCVYVTGMGCEGMYTLLQLPSPRTCPQTAQAPSDHRALSSL